MNITTFELFCAMAPNPDEATVSMQAQFDKRRNPYNEGHKPKLRDTMEIIVDYKIEFAKMMLMKVSQFKSKR